MNKISAYNEIQQTLQEIFLNNLNFFKQNYPLIYNKILAFERLNIENYYIDFVDNKFQLFDLHNKINLYEKEPFEDAVDRVNNFDLGSAFNLIKIETLKKRNHYKNEINAYEYLNEFIEHFNKVPIKINKFIFIGTLLGIHINDFHKILNAKVYLIIEPNIEIFRLSMFMTDYKILATDSKLFFSINEKEAVQKQTIEKFLKYEYQFNNLIHFELAHKINKPLINQISMIFTHLGEMRYPFSDYLISLNRFHYYFIKNKNNLLNLSKIYNFLENKNVLFLGAGPSLEKDLNFVHLNKNKFIIVAVAATLKALETKNIIPDIIITVDGQEIVKEQFEVSKFIYENSIILCSNKLDKNLYSLLKDTCLFFFQNSLNLFKNLGFITGVTVGDMGIDLLLRLGVKNLYLLGIDAAIDSETGKTHINSHSSLKNINLNQENTKQINFNETIIYVKGNFEEKVPTLMEYKEMIEEIDEKFEYLNSNFKIHNLSNGAYFKNTIPIKTSDISLEKDIDKNDFKHDFLINLNTIIEKDLNNIFIKILKKERKILTKLVSLKKDMTFFEEFKNIKQKNSSLILINILEKYFNLILPYYHFLDNKSIANKILEKQLNELIYKLSLIL
jgi:hypothetical protein